MSPEADVYVILTAVVGYAVHAESQQQCEAKPAKNLSKEDVERMIAKLLLEGILVRIAGKGFADLSLFLHMTSCSSLVLVRGPLVLVPRPATKAMLRLDDGDNEALNVFLCSLIQGCSTGCMKDQPVSSYSGWLVCQREVFQHTAYSTNSYICLGSSWRLLAQGKWPLFSSLVVLLLPFLGCSLS